MKYSFNSILFLNRLSSGKWSKVSETRPLCSNHDDGVTAAIIQCETCLSLCADCDRFLHLNRKTRNHRRTVCKEEEDAIRVELHEGCGRTKLFWLLALTDSRTLKAIIEFRDGNISAISGPTVSTGEWKLFISLKFSSKHFVKLFNLLFRSMSILWSNW